MTQEEAAKQLGITRVEYNKIEKGKAVPKFETILKMAHIVNCEYDKERYGDNKVYSTYRIGGMYEVEIIEEE